MITVSSVYLAGPMRGYPKFNFDAFEAAMKDLESKGISVISPHKMDLDIGFDPTTESPVNSHGVPDGFCIKDCIRRDVEAILATEGIVFLPGWEKSKGANAEKAIGHWLDRPMFLYPTLQPL